MDRGRGKIRQREGKTSNRKTGGLSMLEGSLWGVGGCKSSDFEMMCG